MRLSKLLCGVLLAAAFLLSGCAIPVSDFPLTDEKTSTVDERLIGYWKYVPKEKDEETPPAPYLIGRMKDQPNVLQMTWVELDEEQVAKVKQTPLYTTKIDGEHYLSFQTDQENAEPVPMPAKPAKKDLLALDGDEAAADKDAAKKSFLIVRYEISDEGLGSLFIMKPDEIAAAIENGKLKGVVKRQKRSEKDDPNKTMPYNEIRITAEPKELAAFLKTRGKTCFADEEPFKFQRVKAE